MPATRGIAGAPGTGRGSTRACRRGRGAGDAERAACGIMAGYGELAQLVRAEES